MTEAACKELPRNDVGVTQIAPYVTVVVNGIYWEPIYPRLLTTAQTTALLLQPSHRLLGIADISCDIEVCSTRPRFRLAHHQGALLTRPATLQVVCGRGCASFCPQGSVEVTSSVTTIDQPVFFFDGATGERHNECVNKSRGRICTSSP